MPVITSKQKKAPIGFDQGLWDRLQAAQQKTDVPQAIEKQRKFETKTFKRAREEKKEDVAEERKFELQRIGVSKEPTRFSEADIAASADPVRQAETRSLEALSGPEEIYRQILAEGDPLNQGVQDQLFEKGRTGIESGVQAQKGQVAQQFRRGAPGGAALRMIQDVGEAGIGQQTQLKRDIGLEATLGKRKRMLELLQTGAGLASTRAGVIERSGRTLSDIYRTQPLKR